MKYEKFDRLLNSDLSWRKKEISDLFLLAKERTDQVLLKSLILLLYAHWEGFIKKSGKLYLKYISDKNIKIKELGENFHAIALKNCLKRFVETYNSFSIESELEFIEKNNLSEKKFKLKIDPENSQEKSLINTEHNLKEEIFKRIVKIVGLEYKSSLQTKKHYIDARLLANRNKIAHGDLIEDNNEEEFYLTIEEIGNLKGVIMVVMDSFKEELSDYASQEFYLRINSSKRAKYEEDREAYLKKSFERLGV